MVSMTAAASIRYDIPSKLEAAIYGLRPWCSKLLCSISSDENALTIAEYIMTLMTEINLSDHYREDLITVLSKLSSHHGNNKSFKLMTRQDILAFLNRFRKNDALDPLHKWIGTYNLYRM